MSAAEARRAEYLKTRQLLVFLVLPGQTKDLTAFRDTWRQSTGERGEADYAWFNVEATMFLRRCKFITFWSFETDHSLGSPDGPNGWTGFTERYTTSCRHSPS